MTLLIELRTKIRRFLVTRETWAVFTMRFVLSFLALTVVNMVMGYQSILNHWWVVLLISLICMFLPMQGATVVILFFGLLHLMTLSVDVGLAALGLLVVSYIVCSYFQSRDTHHLVSVAVCDFLHVPFLVPIGTGLTRGLNELPSVVLGSVISYFIRVVSQNAPAFMEKDSEMTVSVLVQSKLLTSPMFYGYIATMTVVYILVYYLRTKEMKHAWVIASTVGVIVEFIVMLGGCLFAEGRSGIVALAIGSAVTWIFALVMTFLIQGVDYTRVEKVQYEDDEYYYYVTAVPKMHIAEQDKEIKKI